MKNLIKKRNSHKHTHRTRKNFSESKFRMSNSNSSNSGSNRNGYNFPDFSLRRLLLQARAGRGPYSNRMCDVERGSGSSSSKSEKSIGATSSSAVHRVRF